MILGITGHRPPSLGGYEIPNPIYDFVTDKIREQFEHIRPEKIISGMAQGTDQWAAQIAIEMGIPFIAAVPCDNQEYMWPDDSKKVYSGILDKAHEVVVVSPGPYEPKKMHTRDKWIVDNSNALLGVWCGIEKGGTYATIRHAQKSINRGREYEIFLINPGTLE